MYKALKNSITALALGATVIGGLAATPAFADPGHNNGRGRGHDKHWKHGRHDDRRGDYRRGRDHRPDRVVVVRERPRVVYAYDYNRPDPRYRGYYADRYYRGGYDPIRVNRQTRIYRGYDDRYYCRRSDGTTGLIIGAALGGLIGNELDRGRSSILGAVLGAAGGGLIGREIDRGEVVCR
jgi:uncharacterized protein YcfJ